MSCSSCSKKVVFATEHGSVSQCDLQNCYILDFKGKVSYFKVFDFLNFKRRIDALDLQTMVTDVSPGADVELVMPFRCDVLFILRVQEILQLRELLNGAKFSIELNSLLNAQNIILVSDLEELA